RRDEVGRGADVAHHRASHGGSDGHRGRGRDRRGQRHEVSARDGVNRREFIGGVTAGAAGLVAKRTETGAETETGPGNDRADWVSVAQRLAEPVLTTLAAGTLRARMPVEEAEGAGRRSVSHLEAFGRLLCGIAPWIDLPADATTEGRLRSR